MLILILRLKSSSHQIQLFKRLTSLSPLTEGKLNGVWLVSVKIQEPNNKNGPEKDFFLKTKTVTEQQRANTEILLSDNCAHAAVIKE